jgi:esterase/lipase superfamily enzyme
MGWGRQIKRLAAFVLITFLAACASYDDPYFVHSVWRPSDAAATAADVYFVTDRVKNPSHPQGFEYRRGDTPSCGVVHASIPPARLPLGPMIFARETGREAIGCGVREVSIARAVAVSAHAKHCGDVLIFIHGFDTGFESAVLRAGQLGSDTQWRCAVLAFSWSSAGKRIRYDADVRNNELAEPLLAGLLNALKVQGLRADIVTHSMGALVALGAIAQADGLVAGEVIFSAPDIGVEDFTAALPLAMEHIGRLTIYASDDDAALALSRRFNRGVARIGREPDANYGNANIDVIDASDAHADASGHEYYGLSYEVLADMSLVLAGVPAPDRLNPRDGAQPTLVRGTAYRLNITTDRRPDVFTRALRWFISLFGG